MFSFTIEDISFAASIAALVGVSLRALLPYLQKENVWEWNHKYTLTALVAEAGASLTAWDAARSFARELAMTSEYSLVMVIGASLIWGWFFTSGINKTLKTPEIWNALKSKFGGK
jgi:hypothetical protein